MRLLQLIGGAGLCVVMGVTPTLAQEVQWNVSVWGSPRAVTAGMEAVRDEVLEKTDGNFDIKIHYGEAISPSRENIDGIKIGAFEGAQICSSLHPGKNPVLTVLDLPFLPVSSADSLRDMHEAVYRHPLVVEELAEWNAVPYLSTVLPQQEVMGAGEPPMKLDDWKGVRVRALGGVGDVLRELGAVPTTVSAPETYTAQERGTIQASSFPGTFSFGSYRLYEVSDWYTTNMALGTIGCHFIFNKQAWDGLPESYRDALVDAKKTGYAAYEKAYTEADEEYIPVFKERGLVEIRYTSEQLDEMRRVGGQPVWDAWVEETEAKGIPGREILDFVLAELEN